VLEPWRFQQLAISASPPEQLVGNRPRNGRSAAGRTLPLRIKPSGTSAFQRLSITFVEDPGAVRRRTFPPRLVNPAVAWRACRTRLDRMGSVDSWPLANTTKNGASGVNGEGRRLTLAPELVPLHAAATGQLPQPR
jgi:hypothetical protein